MGKHFETKGNKKGTFEFQRGGMFCKVIKGNKGTWMGKRLETKRNKEGTFRWAKLFRKGIEGNEGTWTGKHLETKVNKEGTFQWGLRCFARWLREMWELGWGNTLKPGETKREHFNGLKCFAR